MNFFDLFKVDDGSWMDDPLERADYIRRQKKSIRSLIYSLIMVIVNLGVLACHLYRLFWMK